jgi:hypothetical protein
VTDAGNITYRFQWKYLARFIVVDSLLTTCLAAGPAAVAVAASRQVVARETVDGLRGH